MAGPEDPHSPTEAGPIPAADAVGSVPAEPADAAAQAPVPPAADPPTEPTPTIGAAEATFGQPAGSAMLGGAGGAGTVDPHPEKLVGAAFAGGLVAALFLKGLARRKHA
jgi:hypothetical protein